MMILSIQMEKEEKERQLKKQRDELIFREVFPLQTSGNSVSKEQKEKQELQKKLKQQEQKNKELEQRVQKLEEQNSAKCTMM